MRRLSRSVLCRFEALAALAFVAFAGFVLLSNQFDWDHFLSAAEVDRRSWLLDLRPPLWSYQLCGGVTRAGDPQAFGLSPLFLPVLLFGSFWGTKFLIVGASVLGYVALARLLVLLLPKPRLGDELLARLVGLSFVLGNGFLWHFHHGHLTFLQIHLVLAMLWLLVEAALGGLSWRKGAALAAVSFSYFSGGFYHSMIFFLLPVALGGLLFLALAALFPRSGWGLPSGAGRRLAGAVGLAGIGLVAASYKLYYVWAHQERFPRAVEQAASQERTGPLEALLYQLAPSFDYRFAGVFKGWGKYGIWEYSSFTLNAWLVVLAAGLLLLRRGARARGLERLFALGACLLVGAALFAVGEQGGPLHRLVNAALEQSIRVAGRYQLAVSFALAFAAVALVRMQGRLRNAVVRVGTVAVPALLCLNLATFRPTLRTEPLGRILSYASVPTARMTEVVVTRVHEHVESYMYQPILLGGAVLNCYDPIARRSAMAREYVGRPELMDAAGRSLRPALYPLIDPGPVAAPASCAAGSYFTQGEVVLDASCPQGTCVNLNAQSDFMPSALRLDPVTQKLCLPSEAAP